LHWIQYICFVPSLLVNLMMVHFSLELITCAAALTGVTGAGAVVSKASAVDDLEVAD
jgi:hypothetical protein